MGANIGEIQGYNCPRCKGNTGYIFLEKFGYIWFCGVPECLKDDVSKQTKETPVTIKQPKDAATVFGIGNRYYNACLAKFDAKNEQKEIISRWMAKPENALVLFGIPGVGKTYFCMAIANYLFEKGKNPVYYNDKRLFETLQTGFGEDKNQYEVIRKIAFYDFLILDDFGACTVTDWKEEMLFALIDQRYNNQLPFVLTTNFDIKTMQEVWGDRIARRINASENIKITLTEVYDKKAQVK